MKKTMIFDDKKRFQKLKKFETVLDIPDLPIVKDKQEWKNFFVKELVRAGAIPKNKLKHNEYYIGRCRNAKIAKWDGIKNKFTYIKEKFGCEFLEDINHFEDDDGFDLFVPIKHYKGVVK